MSIFLGLMLAFLFDYMDQTFRSPDDIERFLGIPFLGSVIRRNMAFSGIGVGIAWALGAYEYLALAVVLFALQAVGTPYAAVNTINLPQKEGK